MKKNFLIAFLTIFNLWFLISFFLNKDLSNRNNPGSYGWIFPDHCVDEMIFSFMDSFFFEDPAFIINEDVIDQLKGLFSQGSKKKLFYRLDFPYCGNCIYPVISHISEYSGISKNDIWILSAFPSEEYSVEFREFVKDKNVNFLNISDFDFTYTLTGLYEPFLFLMDEELKPEKVLFTTQCNIVMIEKSLVQYQSLIKN